MFPYIWYHKVHDPATQKKTSSFFSKQQVDWFITFQSKTNYSTSIYFMFWSRKHNCNCKRTAMICSLLFTFDVSEQSRKRSTQPEETSPTPVSHQLPDVHWTVLIRQHISGVSPPLTHTDTYIPSSFQDFSCFLDSDTLKRPQDFPKTFSLTVFVTAAHYDLTSSFPTQN